jgi:arylsulfatase A-like enzyme
MSAKVHPLLLILALFITACSENPQQQEDPSGPNIVLIMTDDQGFGDLGATGNPLIHTPRIDQLAGQSTQMSTFYVDPVCAPTRSALLTGKHYLRTGVWDTFNGGAIMDPDEITIAEILSEHGYETGIYGKWHLGDTYPSRPSDQGFGSSLVHKAGGIGQPGDLDNFPRPDSSYYNSVLYKDNQPVPTTGYCTDVFTDGALDFIQQNHDTPFFLYVAYNAPHTPLQVPEKYLERYDDMPFEDLTDRERRAARRVYAMVENIDDNVGRILDKLEEHSLSDNTVVIFMTDNGPVPARYNAGLRGLKSSVYEGGIRVPFFIRYPEVFEPRQKVESPVAHIDVLPTLLSICGLDQEIPDGIDGMSFLPALEGKDEAFRERSLYWQWARGYPERYANMAIRKGDYKLVGRVASTAGIEEFELFNLAEDPGEQQNLVMEEREMALALKEDLDAWYTRTVIEEGNPKVQGAAVNPAKEDLLVLSRNDAKGTPEQWTRDAVFSYWDVEFEVEGYYDVTFRFHNPPEKSGKVVIKFAPLQYSLANEDLETMELTLESCYFGKGRGMLEAYYREDFNQIISPLSLTIRKSE